MLESFGEEALEAMRREAPGAQLAELEKQTRLLEEIKDMLAALVAAAERATPG